MKYYAKVGAREFECTMSEDDGALFVEVDQTRYRVDLAHIEASASYTLLVDGRSYEFALHEDEDGIELSGGAGLFRVCVEDARTHAARAMVSAAGGPAGPRLVKAAMPGIVRELLVEDGAVVTKGQPLLILEAMKMQNEIRADGPGTVTRVHVKAGATVVKGEKLLELESPPSP